MDITGVNSLSDAILLAAEQSEVQYPTSFLVVEKNTESGDILYGVVGGDVGSEIAANRGGWESRILVKAAKKR